MIRLLLSILISVFAALPVYAQWGDPYSFGGYLRITPMVWKPASYFTSDENYEVMNIILTRQNFRWYPTTNFTFGLELKSRIYQGGSIYLLKQTANVSSLGASYFDWDKNWLEEDEVLINSTIDRAWLKVYFGDLQIDLGRQRIAWGTNLVWNPVDLFNPSNPMDFTNDEMPGTDAVRAQYYLGPNSKIETAVAPQKEEDETIAAGLLQINLWDYDWIFLGGRRYQETVFGFAWAGSILDGGFRGEFLYSKPRRYLNDSGGYLVASVSGDYTMKNSQYFHGALLYNERGTTDDAGGFRQLLAYMRGELTPARISLWGEIARDLTPLLRGDIAMIFNPYDNSWYLSPNFTYSLITDLDVTAMALIFGGDDGTEFGDTGNIYMMRFKYSF
ncbi:MAG: hypothetical protein GF307_02405 [candidate division Zixibacteria bacterium]|nr:hypothetical protein [candidate division Zixibacteria bacterium]